MKRTRDNEEIIYRPLPQNVLTVEMIEGFMLDFPKGRIEERINLIFREGYKKEERDEYGRIQANRIRIKIETREFSFIPPDEINDRIREECLGVEELETISVNPDYFICKNCKMIHHRLH